MANRNDAGHRETDDVLGDIERQIAREYKQASEEAQGKLDAFLTQFEKEDEQQQQMVDAGTLSEADYLKWRQSKIMGGKRWADMRDVLAQDYANANKIANNVLGNRLKDVYAINRNYGAYEIEHGASLNTSFTLYDHSTVERLLRENPKIIPDPGKATAQKIAKGKLTRWNRKQIDSVMLQSILQGESIPHIAERLARTIGEMDSKAAIRTARTMTTAAENAGRMDSYRRAVDMGIKMKRVWVATLDGRTRHEHRLLDGEAREVDEPFEVEGEEIMYPGDPDAEPYMVYNCRCTLIAAVAGTQLAEGLDGVERESKLGDMSYEDWKNAKSTPKRDKDK